MCCDLRLRTLIMVLVDTGMRVGIEALKLKWIDVDFEESIITVTQSKTTSGLRTLPMTPLVKSALLEWRAATNGISEYVFFNPQRPSVHILSVKTCLAQCSQNGGTSPISDLPVPPHLRDQAGSIGCVGYDHCAVARALPPRRAQVLHRTDLGVPTRCNAAP
jgi:integrase